jgi:hypothetical protein
VPTFFHIRNISNEVGDFSLVERVVNTRGSRFGNLAEVQKFFQEASVGDIFQLQHDEYIVALGNLIRASWLK